MSESAFDAAMIVALLVGGVFGLVWLRRTGRRGFPLAPALAVVTVGVVLVGGLR